MKKFLIAIAASVALLGVLVIGVAVYLSYTFRDTQLFPSDHGAKFIRIFSECDQDVIVFASNTEDGAERSYLRYGEEYSEIGVLRIGEPYTVGLYEEYAQHFIAFGTDFSGPSSIIEVPVETFDIPNPSVKLRPDCVTMSVVFDEMD